MNCLPLGTAVIVMILLVMLYFFANTMSWLTGNSIIGMAGTAASIGIVVVPVYYIATLMMGCTKGGGCDCTGGFDGADESTGGCDCNA